MPQQPTPSPADDAVTLLRQAAAQAAALILLDAVQHRQRMTILSEAASAAVLQRVMAGEGQGADPAPEPAAAIRTAALEHFQAAGLAAIRLFEALPKA